MPESTTAAVDTRTVQGDLDDLAGDSAYDLHAPAPDDARVDLRHLASGFDGEHDRVP